MDVLIIDDEESICTSTSMAIDAEDHYTEAVTNLTVADLRLKEEKFDLIFLDLKIGEENGLEYLKKILKRRPKQLVVMFTAHASIKNAVEATRLGAFDYLSKPFSPDQLRGILVKAEAELKRREKVTDLEVSVEELKSQASVHSVPTRFESDNSKMQETLQTLFLSAKTPASILILGESGTGKSVVAKAVHDESLVAPKPFVTVSCPSLSKELLESELFGHVKGAFTGAVKDSWGKVHAATGGTLFLDEIGELPMEIQPKLLRLLQEKEYERLGENKTRQSNVRIIAATNRDLKQCILDGTFREDLYYRINVITVEMPSLRNRQEDLVRFAEDYLKHFSQQIGKKVRKFSKPAVERLRVYPWPGNLRELRNTIERAVILCQAAEIEESHIPVESNQSLGTGGETSGLNVGMKVSLEELETEHIKAVLASSPSLQEAAEILGIDKATLYRKRKKLEL